MLNRSGRYVPLCKYPSPRRKSSSEAPRERPDALLASYQGFGDFEVEEPRGVEPEYLCTRVFAQMGKIALDRRSRVRPGALVVRVVIRPAKVVLEVERLYQ